MRTCKPTDAGKPGFAPFLMVWACCGLMGCDQSLPPLEFIRAYQEVAAIREERQGYALISLYESPDYLAAQAADGPLHKGMLDSLRSAFGNAYYVNLSIRIANPTGGAEDLRKDIAASSLTEGEAAFSREMERLRTDLAQKAVLATSDGREIPPMTYVLNRGFNPMAGNGFLFVFPKEAHGKPFSIKGCHLVVKDFGLNIGTLRHALAAPTHLRLKAEI